MSKAFIREQSSKLIIAYLVLAAVWSVVSPTFA